MEASGVAGILVVRSVEESAPELIASEARLDAALEAGPLDDEARWLARRAERLLRDLSSAYRTLPAMTEALAGRTGTALAVGALAGVVTNYLGPSQQIHAVYNPVVLLIVWNLFVYALLLVRRLGRGPAPPQRPAASAESAAESPRAEPRGSRPGLLTRWLFRRTVPALWLRLHRDSGEARQESRQLGRVGRRFWSLWMGVAQPLFGTAARRLLNLAAIGLAAGAVLGMFVRGLFLDYHIVWRSTFVNDPQAVAALLKALFSLPALAIGQPIPDAGAVANLLRPEGVPAAGWIWLYASAAALFIGIPRAGLTLLHSLRMRSLSADLDLGLDDPYYEGVLRQAREQRVSEIAGTIETEVRVETRKFAAGIAAWVCETLYDRQIVPRLRHFREEGGRLVDLEAGIASDCEGFQGEFERYFPRAQADFEASLAAAVARTIETDVSFEAPATSGLAEEVRGGSRDAAEAFGRSIGDGINRSVASALSGAVALVAGTLSGGFGKSLGLAIVATLVGTTGPVGFLIGALGGLVAAGAAWLVGRERAAGAVKSLALPGRAARTVLWSSRLERLVADGRVRCHRAVEELIEARLDPLTPQISQQIWTQVKPLLAERQRVSSSEA